MKTFWIIATLLIGTAAITGNSQSANKMLRACYSQKSKAELLLISGLSTNGSVSA